MVLKIIAWNELKISLHANASEMYANGKHDIALRRSSVT